MYFLVVKYLFCRESAYSCRAFAFFIVLLNPTLLLLVQIYTTGVIHRVEIQISTDDFDYHVYLDPPIRFSAISSTLEG